jgi:hypothetical protein
MPKHPTRATVYTQVIESLPVLKIPHPNPHLSKERELYFLVSTLSKGGNLTCVYTVACQGEGWLGVRRGLQ